MFPCRQAIDHVPGSAVSPKKGLNEQEVITVARPTVQHFQLLSQNHSRLSLYSPLFSNPLFTLPFLFSPPSLFFFPSRPSLSLSLACRVSLKHHVLINGGFVYCFRSPMDLATVCVHLHMLYKQITKQKNSFILEIRNTNFKSIINKHANKTNNKINKQNKRVD